MFLRVVLFLFLCYMRIITVTICKFMSIVLINKNDYKNKLQTAFLYLIILKIKNNKVIWNNSHFLEKKTL